MKRLTAITALIVALNGSFALVLDYRRSLQDAKKRQLIWDYTAELHRNSGLPPTTLWAQPATQAN